MTWRAWWSRLRGSLRRDDVQEREMEREMAFHVELAARRNEERGLTAEAAWRQAKLSFGSTEAFKEAAREASRARVAEDVVSDIRFALRSLRRSPSFAVAAILTVAIGIGASTAMFTVVNAVSLRGVAWQETPALSATCHRLATPVFRDGTLGLVGSHGFIAASFMRTVISA
jgi:hypothetical protein